MTTLLAKVRRAAIGVPRREALAFSRGDNPAWRHLEEVVLTAVGGYHAVLDDHDLQVLIPELESTPLDLRGYAYEGAAMGLTGMDCFLPGKSRFKRYLNGPANHHFYMVHLGAGEALARLHRSPERFLRRLDDPVVRWLVMDGYGFHEGFFKPEKFIKDQRVPKRLSPFAARVFDQGLGRAVWFGQGADVTAVEHTIKAFPAHRHADLWLGVGVAIGYVGGVEGATIEAAKAAAGQHWLQIAVGAAFVARGRHRAGNPNADTDLACVRLCALPDSAAASAMVEEEWHNVPDTPSSPAYNSLQHRIAHRIWLLTSDTATSPDNVPAGLKAAS